MLALNHNLFHAHRSLAYCLFPGTQAAAFVSSWPSPIDGYTNGHSSGVLPEEEAVDKDYRQH